VLEGGMTKEDQKRDEIFWNEILAQMKSAACLIQKFYYAKRIDVKRRHKLDKFKKMRKEISKTIYY
jgi:adenine-specific DNA-methyltransferase